MPEQYKYYTLTEDVKTLIQYVQEQAFDHLVVEAANRLNLAIKKGLRDYGIPVTPIKESKDPLEEEKKQYAEDSRTHEKPWELWQYAIKTPDELDWDDCTQPLPWHKYCAYRRKQTAFIPEYYSGLNWRDAKHLIGKTVECTNNPERVWKDGILQKIVPTGKNFYMDWGSFYTYIRTCEETVPHPTINICGVELPMPETVYPEPGTVYWVFGTPATAKDGSLYDSDIWPQYVSKWEKEALKNGVIHLTEERAKAWTDWWKKEVLAKIKEIAS